jgi:hypothetical protein
VGPAEAAVDGEEGPLLPGQDLVVHRPGVQAVLGVAREVAHAQEAQHLLHREDREVVHLAAGVHQRPAGRRAVSEQEVGEPRDGLGVADRAPLAAGRVEDARRQVERERGALPEHRVAELHAAARRHQPRERAVRHAGGPLVAGERLGDQAALGVVGPLELPEGDRLGRPAEVEGRGQDPAGRHQRSPGGDDQPPVRLDRRRQPRRPAADLDGQRAGSGRGAARGGTVRRAGAWRRHRPGGRRHHAALPDAAVAARVAPRPRRAGGRRRQEVSGHLDEVFERPRVVDRREPVGEAVSRGHARPPPPRPAGSSPRPCPRRTPTRSGSPRRGRR